jgi:chemotaxis protein CheC
LVTNTRIAFGLSQWTNLAKIGSTSAVSGLSEMLHRDFTVTALSVDKISEENAGSLIGKVDERVTGIYLLFSGSAEGQILLAFKPEMAYQLVDMAMEIEAGSTTSLGEMERSVLGEMGNIVGTFFLNGLADNLGMCLMPSPPVVVEDMAGALVDSVMAEAFTQCDSIYVMKLLFSSPTKEISGHFLVLPTFEIRSEG